MKKIVFGILVLFLISGCDSAKEQTKQTKPKKETVVKMEEEKPQEVQIKLSFAGDCTLGNYANQTYKGSFDQIYEQQNANADYFFKNVQSIFANDDLTIVNLEGPLTKSTKHLEKKFPFKGDPAHVEILKKGSVEAVTLANNHSEDYFAQGFQETKQVMKENNIGYFGYEESWLKNIKGIKVGFLGYRSMGISMNSESGRKQIKEAINNLRNNQGADAVVVYYHWGIERQYVANDDQRNLAKYTIDCGADLVVGAHPHVLQGIETYKGKQIVYSLGNFCFGGNRNPSDTDSMIYTTTFNFIDGTLVNSNYEIIPCAISSSKGRNDYQPMLLEGSEKQRVLEKVKKYSY